MSSKSPCDDVPVTNIPNNERIQRLNDLFYEEFARKPCFFVRVPGRVNIIGEHIDYCGYPVLPMALEQDILIATGLIEEPLLQIRNFNKKYENKDVIIDFDNIIISPDDNGKPYWYNYILCGVKGALEHLNNKMNHGVRFYIDGNVLPASGLSSSSALVSASCLAFLHAQNVTMSKTEIAALCAKSERYIGTQGGGMDQAIAFLGEKYCAQYITWNPLNATPVALPEDAAFVVAHSLAEANKAATNDFNRRVIECRLAAKILEIILGVSKNSKIITLSEIQKTLGYPLEEMIKTVYEYLPKTVYTKEEVCKMLKVDEDTMDDLYLTPNTKHLKEFKLKQRALHVYEEAIRVEEFRKICTQSDKRTSCNGNGSNGSRGYTSGNGDISCRNTLECLGKLMTASHESLKLLYECSHDNLDILVDLSSKMNVHARLTGAGWGGCVVALCPKEDVEKYINMLEEEFYKKHCNIKHEKSNKYVFATTPNFGAMIYK